MRDIPRETINEKVEGLIEYSSELYDEMDHFAYLKSLPFNFSSARLNFLRDLSTILGFLINLIMIASYETIYADGEGEEFKRVAIFVV